MSLSTPLSESGGITLEDAIEDRSAQPDEQLIRMEKVVRIREAVEQLEVVDPRLPEIVRRRWGFGGEEPQTLQYIGDSMGVSRERIRQLEVVAKKRLAVLLVGEM